MCYFIPQQGIWLSDTEIMHKDETAMYFLSKDEENQQKYTERSLLYPTVCYNLLRHIDHLETTSRAFSIAFKDLYHITYENVHSHKPLKYIKIEIKT